VADVVSELAAVVSKTGFQHANLIPELARMAIEKTALNLNTLLPSEEGSGQHLLIVAIQQALTAVAQPTGSQQWKPALSGAQLLNIANNLMDEVVSHPEWVTAKAGENSLLSQVLQVSLQAMSNIPSEKRLQGDSFRLVMQASLKGVAMNQLLLSKLPISPENGTSTALGYALDAVFAQVFGNKDQLQASMSLMKGEVLAQSLEKILGRLAGQPISVSLIDNAIELEFGGVQHKMLASLLQGFNGIKLGEPLKDRFFQKVAPALLTQGMALVQDKAPALAKDQHFQQLIAGSSEQIATALAARLQGEQSEESWKVWGQEVLGSLVGQASSLVMDATSEFFASSQAEKQFVQSAGAALVEVVAEQGLVAVFKGQALDQVVGALLGALSSYPDAFSSKEPIKRILADIAQVTMESGIRRPGLVPELLRMSLDKAKGNLHLIWEPAGGRSLMALSLQSVLGALAQPPQDGRWRPQFSAEQLTGLMNNLLDEVVRNPAWVSHQLGSKTLLQQVVGESLKAMEAIPIEARLHPDTAKLVLKQSVKATALRKQLLDKVDSQQTVIFYALDQLFEYLFVSGDPQVKWVATQQQVLNTLLEHYIEKLATESAGVDKANSMLEKLKIEFGKVSDNMPFDSVIFLKGWLMSA
jgi:hypothetical protein